MLQSSMLDETGNPLSPSGVYDRIVKFDNGTGQAVAQYAYRMKRSNQGQGVSALVALNNDEFLVLERNNRGIGVGATLATADKEVYKINLTGATDVTNFDLDSGASFTAVTKSGPFLDLDVNTLAALGNKSPEKWEGLAIGPQLNDGSYLLLAGTDNDYSVTQNGTGTQFDVYFRFTDANPYNSSVQCPIGQTTGCFNTADAELANPTLFDLPAGRSLLPGVLHAYKVSAADLGLYIKPVPLPPALALLAPGAALLMRRRRRVAR
jgi:hypothetical protein